MTVHGLYWVCPSSTTRNAVPLVTVQAKADIVDMAAKVTVVQHYRPRLLQTFMDISEKTFSYAFPLNDKAAVCGFSLKLDGCELDGIVKEKEKAQQEYRTAIQRGNTAALLEEEKADVFSICVGNIPVDVKEVSVTITYLVELKMDSEAINFFLPTTVGARYTPVGEIAVHSKNPPAASIVLTVDWTMPCGIISLTSPTHAATCVNNKNPSNDDTHHRANATIRSSLGEDIVVLCKPMESHQPRVCVETDPSGNRVMMLTMVPELTLNEQKCEYIFVIDRSGSMSGERMANARAALNLFLQSLPEDSYVNLVGFGSRYNVLFPSCSKRYNEESLRSATKYANEMDANFGGTELIQPLQHIYTNMTAIKGYSRQVFLLTDGQVSNTERVISLVREQHKTTHTRMFTLGIGGSVSHHLVNGMARAGKGTSEFVTNMDRLPITIVQQLKASFFPPITDITINWLDTTANTKRSTNIVTKAKPIPSLLGYITPSKRVSEQPVQEGNRRQTPFNIPPIFSGERLIAYYFVSSDCNIKFPKEVTITAVVPGEIEPLVTELPVLPANIYSDTDIIHTLAARSMIQDLEEGDSYLGNNVSTAKDEIIKLGVKYNLASRHTSYLIVDHNTKVERTPQHILHYVPDELPYAMSTASMGMHLPLAQCSQVQTELMELSMNEPRVVRGGGCMARSFNKKSNKMFKAGPPPTGLALRTCASVVDSVFDSDNEDECNEWGETEADSKTKSQQEKMSAFVRLQAFDGSFKYTTELLAVADVQGQQFMEAMDRVFNATTIDRETRIILFSTALALSLMMKDLTSKKDALELVASKSERFLKSKCDLVSDTMLKRLLDATNSLIIT
eukprot:CFRG3712T1